MTDTRPPELWEQRFRASDVTFPSWARLRPERLVYASSETGAYQVYAHDLTTGLRRRVTDVGIGTQSGLAHPDGSAVVWFDDPRGDEVGHWVREGFEEPTREPLVDGVPDAWSCGLALGVGVTVVGTATADEYAVHVARGDQPAKVVYTAPTVVEIGPIDRAERLLAIAHGEHGDSLHLAVRVLDLDTGATVADLWDGRGMSLSPVAFAPVEGDNRLLLVSELPGLLRPTVWDVVSGERRDYELTELPGDVTAWGWFPQADAVLVTHALRGRDELYRLDLASGRVERVAAPAGSLLAAKVRPDGAIWVRHASGAEAPSVRDAATGAEVAGPDGPRAPRGHEYEPWSFRNPHGETVYGFLVEPAGGSRPHPTVLLVHGGPHWLWADSWRPEVAAWVDHGWAVAMVNYRGSTGHGSGWRDRLIGDPGFPELEDEVAGLDDLIARGITDPARAVVSGGSWGGYITLLAMGRHPDRWAAGIGVVPVADYVAAFEDEAPALQAMDRDLFGGDPTEAPALYAERSPITYVDRVKAPLLIIAGDNDSRCPIRQVHNYVKRLVELGVDHHLDVFDAGHGSMVAAERVRHMRLELDFLAERGLLAR
jgi:dipeptidyl aminopeptidase/acylaminoacyl peptidase